MTLNNQDIEYFNKLMESNSDGQKAWASEKLYEIYQQELKKPEAGLSRELMKHMNEVLEIIRNKKTNLKELTNKLLDSDVKPNGQIIKVLKGELLSPAKEISTNFIPNIKTIVKGMKHKKDDKLNFNNVTIKCNTVKELLDSMNDTKNKEVIDMTTIKDVLIRKLLKNELEKVKGNIQKELVSAEESLQRKIAIEESIDKTVELKAKYKELLSFDHDLIFKGNEDDNILNLSLEELEKVTGSKYLHAKLFN